MSQLINVLVIEDNPTDVVLLREQLKEVPSIQFSFDTADTLRGGLEKMASNSYDAVLLDLGLPDADGQEGIKRLVEADRMMPLIVLTGLADEEEALRAVAMGAQDYLIKGETEASLLVRSIRYAIERKNMQVEQEMMERQIQQTQKLDAIGTLAGGIAHDINNMLTPVLALAEVGRMADNADFNEIFDEIRDSVLHASDLVQQILVYSRRARDEDPEPVPIHYAVAQAMKLVRKTIPSTVSIQQDIPTEAGIVRVDRTAIQQVVINLCINAAQAMSDDGGVLAIEVSDCLLGEQEVRDFRADGRGGAYARIKVQDNGKGIPADVVERIFDPFFTTKEAGEGTGLGLTVSQGVVKRHGGFITVDTEVGRGSTFCVYLPLIDDEDALPNETTASVPGGQERVMLIDDEPRLLEAVQLLLNRLGYDVVAHQDSIAACEWLEAQSERPVDLIITDQTMPRMTGLQVARRVLQRWPDIPVLLTTGYSDKAKPEVVKAAGIHSIVYKPFQPRELARQLRAVFEPERLEEPQNGSVSHSS
ncbi:MAG: histidine kinase/response regulator receiver domain-containing protein [Puniceicoccaceae bacterium 5H]|nr:MAG: histidine kinase/response regulator receiver domain-containing protein [Puniceicoccaceae bacterium 5H]